MTILAYAIAAINALLIWSLFVAAVRLGLEMKRRPDVIRSHCKRYWFAVDHDPVDGYTVIFRPDAVDALTERRTGFATPDEAGRCIDLLVREHFVEQEECSGI